ncbi:hypothetical protein [Actinoplanes subtropicus]|uniref:hypothetical protein n=1 Tax=Actinoplanes subtropicus TaxID=543632 RepID=UPI0004C35186|nr:hypothetical protein [Actinoplanes subtropicus]
MNRITARVLITLAVLLAACGPGGDLPSSVPGCADLPEGASAGDGDVLTPYPGMSGDRFLRGATLDLDQAGSLDAQLRTMRDRYRIDTVGVYRLDQPEPFFAALGRLGMTAVLRLEEYDPDSFAFTDADVDRLLARYSGLLAQAAAPGHRSLVTYLAVNMPLDDPRVQARLGGANSPLSISRQVAYASSVVARLRQVAPGLPVYLGVFYGWDGGFRPPSYRPAGADGYFLTSYSYPGAHVPGRPDDDAALIDADRRHAVMRRFLDQYGDAPVVVEYGVQTADHRGGQTAGLVTDRAAKRRALAATTRFYCAGYGNVRGTMYFGFNIVKTEGEPPGTVDFALS